LEFDRFANDDDAFAVASAAMNFLANMEALIFDLRECQGGNPDSVTLICSYLFEGEPVHLNSLYWRDEDRTEEYWTLPEVPGARMGDVPVYVLTSKTTFSAGEEFAYDLQALKRATLIGETTSGGAHPGSPFRLHPHFEMFVPLGMAINPVTGGNWEGVGVVPDIEVSADEALGRAHQLALEGVIASLDGAKTRAEQMLLAEARAAVVKLKRA
ncbi:MAG: S41 family peptidase, partial [Anaerolineales bacterium]